MAAASRRSVGSTPFFHIVVLGVLFVVLVSVLPASASIRTIPAGASMDSATIIEPGKNGTECAWDSVNWSYPGYADFGSLEGLGSSALTIHFKGLGGVGYLYILDVAALVCSVPVGVNNFQVYVNASAPILGSGASWIIATLQGGSPEGYAGTLDSSGNLWQTGTTAGSLPNNGTRNPDLSPACDSSGGGIHVPYNGWNGSGEIAQTWSYSLNTTAQWTKDQCTQGHAGPPGLTVTASSNTTEAFYFLSLAATNVSSLGLLGSPSLTLDAVSNPWLSSVSIVPSAASVPVKKTVFFNATVECLDGGCPSGAHPSWSLTDYLGGLNVSIGNQVRFLAGPEAGLVTLFVNITIDGKTLTGSANITIVARSTSPTGNGGTFLGLPGDDGYLLLGGALTVAVVVVVVAVSKRRRRHIPVAATTAYPTSAYSVPPPPPS